MNSVVTSKQRFKHTINLTTTEGKDLVLRAIYGLDHSLSKFSNESVHFIAQGTPTLKEASPKDKPKSCGIAYELQFSDSLSVSGDLDHFKSDGYEPILLARYTAGRHFYINQSGVEKKFTGARILIGPTLLAPTAKELKL